MKRVFGCYTTSNRIESTNVIEVQPSIFPFENVVLSILQKPYKRSDNLWSNKVIQFESGPDYRIGRGLCVHCT